MRLQLANASLSVPISVLTGSLRTQSSNLLVHRFQHYSIGGKSSRRAPPPARPFSATSISCKKKPKPEPTEPIINSKDDSKDVPEKDANDPYDFSELEGSIQKALDRLRNTLAKLRGGGRFNPEVLEALRVTLGKGSKETVKLGDLAQVVPRGGRTIAVMVGDASHIKPITSAIISSPHSLNPVANPHSSLELTIPIPPPTQESRQQTLNAATKAGDDAGQSMQHARAAQKKVLRAIELGRKVRPDDLKKAGVKMEKVIEKATAEVKGIVDGARRALERV